MARPRKVEPPIPNGFVASAAQLPYKQGPKVTPVQGWMGSAWAYYDTIGELRFVANWVGNMMSRAELKVFHKEVDVYLPVDKGPASEAMDAYFGGVQGQEQMLHQTGVHLTVPGECYHVMVDDEDWFVLASGSVTQDRMGQVTVTISGQRHIIADGELASRFWTPHPRDPAMADSPVRSNLGTLSEIKRLADHASAQLDSRLAGAGVLFMPSEIQFAVPEGIDPQLNQADAFMQVLGEAMMTPIVDRSSASAIVPIVVTAPGDSLSKVQHLTFWTPLDEATIAMRDNAIKRLALGMDVPPEVLLGVADTNHWNAWMVDESSIKAHLEPRLGVVAHGVTVSYLQPSLQGLVKDPENYVAMADTSKIRMRPNRSNEAISLYDRGELAGDALRRETGFMREDAPEYEEFIGWLLRKVATGSTSPDQTVAALKQLGIDLGILGEGGVNKQPSDSLRTDTSRRSDRATNKRTPDRNRALTRSDNGQAAVAAACDVLVWRALERAGNRLCDAKARANGLGTIPATQRHLTASGNPDHLLEGAWVTADEVLNRYTANSGELLSALDMYVRGLLTSNAPHSYDSMVAALSAASAV